MWGCFKFVPKTSFYKRIGRVLYLRMFTGLKSEGEVGTSRQQLLFNLQPQPGRSAMTDEICSECCWLIKLKRVRGENVISIGLVGGWLQTWVKNEAFECIALALKLGRSALCLLVLLQMIWQEQHWSQHLRMPGLLTLCTPLSWLQASLMQPSLTQQLLPPLRPCTPRWGTNRCVCVCISLYLHFSSPPHTPPPPDSSARMQCPNCRDRTVKRRVKDAPLDGCLTATISKVKMENLPAVMYVLLCSACLESLWSSWYKN